MILNIGVEIAKICSYHSQFFHAHARPVRFGVMRCVFRIDGFKILAAWLLAPCLQVPSSGAYVDADTLLLSELYLLLGR